jgi:hypothetical protein
VSLWAKRSAGPLRSSKGAHILGLPKTYDQKAKLMASIPELEQEPTFSFPDLDGEQKLKELILYVADKCEDDPRFGATKLNKILAFSDFVSYYRTGTPITGVEYMRLPQGPVPRRMLPILNEMEDAGEVAIRLVEDGKYTQKRVIPLREPNLDIFQATEIAVVDEVIRAFWKATASAVSEFSHGIAWKIAGDRGLIPYESALLSDDPITEYDRARSVELSREFGW